MVVKLKKSHTEIVPESYTKLSSVMLNGKFLWNKDTIGLIYDSSVRHEQSMVKFHMRELKVAHLLNIHNNFRVERSWA